MRISSFVACASVLGVFFTSAVEHADKVDENPLATELMSNHQNVLKAMSLGSKQPIVREDAAFHNKFIQGMKTKKSVAFEHTLEKTAEPKERTASIKLAAARNPTRRPSGRPSHTSTLRPTRPTSKPTLYRLPPSPEKPVAPVRPVAPTKRLPTRKPTVRKTIAPIVLPELVFDGVVLIRDCEAPFNGTRIETLNPNCTYDSELPDGLYTYKTVFNSVNETLIYLGWANFDCGGLPNVTMVAATNQVCSDGKDSLVYLRKADEIFAPFLMRGLASFASCENPNPRPASYPVQSPTNYDPTASDPSGSYPPASNPSGFNPPASNPSGFNPPASNPSGFNPPASNPSGFNPPASYPSGFNPPASNPSGFNPPASNPSGFNPPASNPSGFNPPASNPSGFNPPASNPSGFNPPASSPSGFNPPASYPSGFNPPASYPSGFNPPASNPSGFNPPASNPSGFNPPASNPSGFNPPASNPSGFNPPASNPSGFNPPASNPSGFNPPASNPSGFNPPASNPSGSYPPASNPSGFNPPASNPSGFNPPASNPSGSYPPASNPSGFNPPASNPNGFNPPASNPSGFNPPASNPSGFDPPASYPASYDPPASNPSTMGADDDFSADDNSSYRVLRALGVCVTTTFFDFDHYVTSSYMLAYNTLLQTLFTVVYEGASCTPSKAVHLEPMSTSCSSDGSPSFKSIVDFKPESRGVFYVNFESTFSAFTFGGCLSNGYSPYNSADGIRATCMAYDTISKTMYIAMFRDETCQTLDYAVSFLDEFSISFSETLIMPTGPGFLMPSFPYSNCAGKMNGYGFIPTPSLGKCVGGIKTFCAEPNTPRSTVSVYYGGSNTCSETATSYKYLYSSYSPQQYRCISETFQIPGKAMSYFFATQEYNGISPYLSCQGPTLPDGVYLA